MGGQKEFLAVAKREGGAVILLTGSSRLGLRGGEGQRGGEGGRGGERRRGGSVWYAVREGGEPDSEGGGPAGGEAGLRQVDWGEGRQGGGGAPGLEVLVLQEVPGLGVVLLAPPVLPLPVLPIHTKHTKLPQLDNAAQVDLSKRPSQLSKTYCHILDLRAHETGTSASSAPDLTSSHTLRNIKDADSSRELNATSWLPGPCAS